MGVLVKILSFWPYDRIIENIDVCTINTLSSKKKNNHSIIAIALCLMQFFFNVFSYSNILYSGWLKLIWQHWLLALWDQYIFCYYSMAINLVGQIVLKEIAICFVAPTK